MLTEQLVHQYIEQLTGPSGWLRAFAPELTLCGTIVALLLAPLLSRRRSHLSWVALLGSGVALWLAIDQWRDADQAREIFQGLLIVDAFTIFLRVFLIAFLAAVVVLTMLTGIPDAEDSADFYTLLLGAGVGMCLMGAANNLLMVFMSIEMASVPSYAMAGFLKGRRQSSEAALKYVVYGGAAAGVMLYGLSLLAGMFGTLHLPTLAKAMLEHFAAHQGEAFSPAVMLALMLVMVGFAFKLSAVPFHFWCPDVFEGAAAEVGAFLSVASKGAAIGLLVRFVSTIVGMSPAVAPGVDWSQSIAAMTHYLSPTLAVVAAVTCTFGNLAAYAQTNIKRMLAYSTIAHAGYMLMGLAPLTRDGATAALQYLIFYFLMNLGAFAVTAFVRNKTGSEELSAFSGLIHRAPLLAISMCVFLVSLTGLPPLAGFPGKFMIFWVLYKTQWYSLLVIGGVNTVFSLVYYVNVMRVMVIQGEPTREKRLESFGPAAYATVLAVLTLWFGIFFQKPLKWSTKGTASLAPAAKVTVEADVGVAPVVARRNSANDGAANP